jgi:hypothetical protein
MGNHLDVLSKWCLVMVLCVNVTAEQRLCGKPCRRLPSLSCWIEVVGLEELVGEGIAKKIARRLRRQ